MSNSRVLKQRLSLVYAITEKEITLQLRFKFSLFLQFILPIIAIIMPLIIMGKIFSYNETFGTWNANNYIIYQFIAYHIALLRSLIHLFPYQFHQEKYWYTLQALIIAPFNRLYLLFGIFFSQIILILIPFSIVLGLSLFFYSISFSTFLFIIFLYFLVALIFSGIGIIIGIFAISKENYWHLLEFGLTIIFWFSCITYPFEIFPKIIQDLINLNPFYHIFDVLRLSWIENNLLFTISAHSYKFLLLLSSAILLPLVGVYIFNIIYKKYGIVGY